MPSGTCVICQRTHGVVENHHVIPREFGGEHGPQVPLCGACHSGIHAEALSLLGKQTIKKHYFSGIVAERAHYYIEQIVLAQLTWESTSGIIVKRKIMAELKPETLAKLHRLKADRGFKNISKFLEALIEAVVKNQ